MAALVVAAPLALSASVIVAPNGFENAAGTTTTITTLNTQFANTIQVVISSSQLGAMPVGSTITGVGFRLAPGEATFPPAKRTFPLFDLVFGYAAREPGNLSATYAANILVPGQVQEYSANFTLNAGTFAGVSSGVAPFGFIHFSTPFVYQGGSLVYQLRQSATGNFEVPLWDAVTPQAGVLGAVAAFDANGTAGTIITVTPVVALEFTAAPTPEPATWAVGVGLAALVMMRRRYSTAQTRKRT